VTKVTEWHKTREKRLKMPPSSDTRGIGAWGGRRGVLRQHFNSSFGRVGFIHKEADIEPYIARARKIYAELRKEVVG
jgi:hypothetical protein